MPGPERTLSIIVAIAIAAGACAGPPATQPITEAPASATTALLERPLPTVPPATPWPSPTATPRANPTAQQLTSTAIATNTATISRPPAVLGYYVPYDVTSWLSMEAQADRLDYVAPQWLSIDPCGSLSSSDDRTLVTLARNRGVRVLPTLLTSDPVLNHRILTDDQARERAVQQIVSYVVDEGYDGFDLDLEEVAAGDRNAYTAFVAKLSTALHAKGKLLMAALVPKRADVATGRAAAYDFAAIAPHLDFALIMAYAYSWSTSPPGSTAPYNWVDEVMAYAAAKIPAQKVLLGLAFYGYDWNISTSGRARALTYPQAVAIANQYGKTITADGATLSATFSYTARLGDKPAEQPPLPALNHVIAERKAPACARPLPKPTPAPTQPPRPTPTPAPAEQHVVWLEDGPSVAARLQIAKRYGLGGVGAWRLGQEDPAVWPALEKWQKNN